MIFVVRLERATYQHERSINLPVVEIRNGRFAQESCQHESVKNSKTMKPCRSCEGKECVCQKI